MPGDEFNLLDAPRTLVRKVTDRGAKDSKDRETALQFGREFFDGTREQGYGGYVYDGRWIPVAKRLIARYGLQPGDRVLDVGCAKGFLVHDLLDLSIDAYGIDISHYALTHGRSATEGRLCRASGIELPFADNSFDAVVSLNTIHNFNRPGCIAALREMTRVCSRPDALFVQVDAFETPEQKDIFERWCLTAETYLPPTQWLDLFAEADYRGDYWWTILDADACP